MEMTVINFNGPKTTQPVPAEGPINVELTRTNFFTRRPCTVCGGCTEKVDVLAEGHGVRVCESCLRDGDIDGRLERHAAQLEADAKQIRGLIGRLRTPTYQAWLAEMDLCEAEYRRCTVEELPARRNEDRRWAASDDIPF
jgi:hypothetical protein